MKLTMMERCELVDRAKAMDEEERALTLKCFPTKDIIAEFSRRVDMMESTLKEMREIANK